MAGIPGNEPHLVSSITLRIEDNSPNATISHQIETEIATLLREHFTRLSWELISHRTFSRWPLYSPRHSVAATTDPLPGDSPCG